MEIGGVAIYGPFEEFRRLVWSLVWFSRTRPTTGILLAPCHDVFRGPRFDYVRQVALEKTDFDSLCSKSISQLLNIMQWQMTPGA
ncbi:hypothetical protein TNCV_1339151 [Trichonephila clavipes]|uniref:Uncharacterized protein n=1 Tax=Trichonephila clavipes TaxID=2585209 RepID=A0A8X6R6C3_TRICX|nr:hypothetical protein TNCV_1339151 [Trichonephila clavipes]